MGGTPMFGERFSRPAGCSGSSRLSPICRPYRTLVQKSAESLLPGPTKSDMGDCHRKRISAPLASAVCTTAPTDVFIVSITPSTTLLETAQERAHSVEASAHLAAVVQTRRRSREEARRTESFEPRDVQQRSKWQSEACPSGPLIGESARSQGQAEKTTTQSHSARSTT